MDTYCLWCDKLIPLYSEAVCENSAGDRFCTHVCRAASNVDKKNGGFGQREWVSESPRETPANPTKKNVYFSEK